MHSIRQTASKQVLNECQRRLVFESLSGLGRCTRPRVLLSPTIDPRVHDVFAEIVRALSLCDASTSAAGIFSDLRCVLRSGAEPAIPAPSGSLAWTDSGQIWLSFHRTWLNSAKFDWISTELCRCQPSLDRQPPKLTRLRPSRRGSLRLGEDFGGPWSQGVAPRTLVPVAVPIDVIQKPIDVPVLLVTIPAPVQLHTLDVSAGAAPVSARTLAGSLVPRRLPSHRRCSHKGSRTKGATDERLDGGTDVWEHHQPI